jgi:hypothetical protein
MPKQSSHDSLSERLYGPLLLIPPCSMLWIDTFNYPFLNSLNAFAFFVSYGIAMLFYHFARYKKVFHLSVFTAIGVVSGTAPGVIYLLESSKGHMPDVSLKPVFITGGVLGFLVSLFVRWSFLRTDRRHDA